MLRSLILCSSVFFLAAAAHAQEVYLVKSPTSSERCALQFDGPVCFYVFNAETNSSVFPLPSGARVSWEVRGDGVASIQFQQCFIYNSGAGGYCAVMELDANRDGHIDDLDEDFVYDGAPGSRGARNVRVSAPYGKIVVSHAPSSGNGVVAVTVSR